nr:hypothetical protein L203_05843 [Cryptococcus depauperatus CBS 7841]
MLFCVFLMIPATWAVPLLVHPIATQMPPIARTGLPYNFELLSDTFNASKHINYTASGLPGWLKWNAPTLSFYGTPGDNDEGEKQVTVTATDDSGSASSNYTLIVSNHSSPVVHQSFYTQMTQPNLHDIASATILPGGTGVSIPPWWSFSLGFQPDTFSVAKSGGNGNLYNDVRVRGSTGLPNWLHFDNRTFTFSGVAPGEGSFTIVATGTDFWGYTGAQTSFVIEIGTGAGIELDWGFNFTQVEAIAKGKVDYELDISGIRVGGQVASKSDLKVTLANDDYDWLAFDRDTNILSGTVPESYQNGTSLPLSVPLTIASTNTSNSLTLDVWLPIDIVPYFFSAYDLPNGTASPSQHYSFGLSPFRINNTTKINATVSPSDAGSWLTFSNENMTLTGTVPQSPKYNQVSVVFEATIGNLTATATHNLTITGISDNSGSTGTTPVPTPSEHHHHGLSEGGRIALGVIFGLLGLILLMIIAFFLCCRRRRDRKDDNEGEKRPRQSAPNLGDPFRKSVCFDPPRSLRGGTETLGYANTTVTSDTLRSPASLSTNATVVDKLQRMDGMKGIIKWDVIDGDQEQLVHNPDFSQGFIGYPDIIATNNPIDQSRDDMSSYTHSLMSESSRASWRSKSSFEWSSGDGSAGESQNALSHGQDLERAGALGGSKMSVADSIPRPRADFTPRYPRHRSPAVLARLTGDDSTSFRDSFSDFSYSHDSVRDSFHNRSGLDHGSSYDKGSMMGSGSVFQSQSQIQSGSGSGSLGFSHSRLSRIGESTATGLRASDTEGDSEPEPAVVATARWTSFDARQGGLRILTHDRAAREAQTTSGIFDDADETSHRSTMLYPDPNNSGLGYKDVIHFGSPLDHATVGETGNAEARGFTSQRKPAVPLENIAHTSTIHQASLHENPLSPRLPQAGSFIRHRRTNTAGTGSQSSSRAVSGANNGRVFATFNETFSIHPAIYPPPTVSLSAATWSSSPPSTYRAEVEGEGSLPMWLHFDARELELWGVPPIEFLGEIMTIRILERLPRDARRMDPMSFGYEPPQEKEVGRMTIEITDRLKSPQFPLDGKARAL